MDNELCIICGKDFKHRKIYLKTLEHPDLYECKMTLSHKRCENLIKKREKLKEQMLNIEYELFCINEDLFNDNYHGYLKLK